jgi:hypothetical protein
LFAAIPDHAGADRGRIRLIFPSMRRERAFASAPITPGEGDPLAGAVDACGAPAAGQDHEDVIGDRLAGEARPGGPKVTGTRQRRLAEHGADLVLVAGVDDELRDEPVEAGVRAVREGAKGILGPARPGGRP